MSTFIGAPLSRGESGLGPFPTTYEQDFSSSYLTVGTLAERDAIPEWKRRSNMRVFVIAEGSDYRLGTNLTIAGQVWTDITVQLPSNIVTEDEIFDNDGFVLSSKLRNLFINDSFVVASEAEMLALNTVVGNAVVRTDTGAVFIKLNNDSPSELVDFADITANTGAVTSVFGDTGVVDPSLDQILARGTNGLQFDTRVAGNNAITNNSAAISTLQTQVADIDNIVSGLSGAATDGENGIEIINGNVGLTASNPIVRNTIIPVNNGISFGFTGNDTVDTVTGGGFELSLLGGTVMSFGRQNKSRIDITSSVRTDYFYNETLTGNVTLSGSGSGLLVDREPIVSWSGISYGTLPDPIANTLIWRDYANTRVAGIPITGDLATPAVDDNAKFIQYNSAGNFNLGTAIQTASNGLTSVSGTGVILGGSLTTNTTIAAGTNSFAVSATSPTLLGQLTLSSTSLSLAWSDVGLTSFTSYILNQADSSHTWNVTNASLNFNSTTALTYNSDYSALYTDRSLVDRGFSVSQIGGRAVDSVINSPGAAQNGYAITWDQTSNRYNLSPVVAGGSGDNRTDRATVSPSSTLNLATAITQLWTLTSDITVTSISGLINNQETFIDKRGNFTLNISTSNFPNARITGFAKAEDQDIIIRVVDSTNNILRIAYLDSSLFLGIFTSLSALQTAFPTPPIEGSYAHVDTGVGNNLVVYAYDVDEGWIAVTGSLTPRSAGNGLTLNGNSLDLGDSSMTSSVTFTPDSTLTRNMIFGSSSNLLLNYQINSRQITMSSNGPTAGQTRALIIGGSGINIGIANSASDLSIDLGHASGIVLVDNILNRGLIGSADFSATIQSLDYTQKSYVDGRLNGFLTGTLSAPSAVNIGSNSFVFTSSEQTINFSSTGLILDDAVISRINATQGLEIFTGSGGALTITSDAFFGISSNGPQSYATVNNAVGDSQTISIQTGNSTGATTNSGNITLTTGTATGTRGSVIIQGLTYPIADGTNGQVITTNGSGILSFSSAASGITNNAIEDEIPRSDASGNLISSGLSVNVGATELNLRSVDRELRIQAGNNTASAVRNILIATVSNQGFAASGNLTLNTGSAVGVGSQSGNISISVGTATSGATRGSVSIGDNGDPTLTLNGYAWATSDGTAGQVLSTNGNRVLSFVDPGGITNGAANQELPVSDGTNLIGSGLNVVSSTELLFRSTTQQLTIVTGDSSNAAEVNLVLTTRAQNNSGDIAIITGNGNGNGNSSGNIIINPGAALSGAARGNLTLGGLNWPRVDGTAGYVIGTNGSGVLSFIDPLALGTPANRITSLTSSATIALNFLSQTRPKEFSLTLSTNTTISFTNATNRSHYKIFLNVSGATRTITLPSSAIMPVSTDNISGGSWVTGTKVLTLPVGKYELAGDYDGTDDYIKVTDIYA